jgi:hypothetical protein
MSLPKSLADHFEPFMLCHELWFAWEAPLC